MLGIPNMPLLLGALGLIPFIVLSLAMLFGAATLLSFPTASALSAYGAVILSFLGGIRWGLA